MNMHVLKSTRIPMLAPVSNDPIFGLIEECRAASLDLNAATIEYDNKDGKGVPPDHPAFTRDEAAMRAIYDTAPTTMAGATAKIELLKEIERNSIGRLQIESLCALLDKVLPRSDERVTAAQEIVRHDRPARPRESRDAKISRACGELESGVHDLTNMAQLAADAVEEAMAAPARISRAQAETVLFAVYHLQRMIEAHKASYFKAMHFACAGGARAPASD
jgi:hypothetical protein